MTKIPNILYIKRDDGGCGFFRCEQPATFLDRKGLANTKTVMKQVSSEELLWADLVVFQEMGSEQAGVMARFCSKNKIPFIVEIDDFLHHVSPHNEGGYHAWNPGTLLLHRSMTLAQRAMAMTVSTNQLAREYYPYNQMIYVVPNFLDKDRWDQPLVKKTDGKIRIGWMGGNAHGDDLKMISKVLERLVKENKNKVIFETMGMSKSELSGTLPLKQQDHVCQECGHEGELHIYPGETLENYPMMAATKGWDIAVAPVINNAFGNSKSDLKVKEYAALGLPIVASPIVPYREAQERGATIHFAETYDEWYNTLKKLIRSKKKREEEGRQNKAWIQKYWIQDNIDQVFEVYSQILQMAKAVYGDKQTTPITHKSGIMQS